MVIKKNYFWTQLTLLNFFVSFVYLFIYLPIIVLIVFSFNSVAFPYRWVSFSTMWYQQLFNSPEILQAFKNSLIVASCSVLLSLTLGLLWVFYGVQSKLDRRWTSIFYVNLMVPEIILALGLLTLFTTCTISLGLVTLIAAHTVLGLGYTIPILSSRFYELDYSIIEASFDLGASVNQTFLKVFVPALLPAVFAAGLLVFIMSFDDFLISFFCAGSTAQTLPLYIFAMIRGGISPVINALSTLLLLLSSLMVLLFSLFKVRTRIF